MKGMFSSIKTVVNDLNDITSEWALIGALAASFHSEPRTTQDIDIALALRTTEEQEVLIKKLLSRGYHNKQILMQVGPFLTMGCRLQIPSNFSNTISLDLLFNASGIEDEIVEQAAIMDLLPGLKVRIASLGHILAMKIVSQNDGNRIKDKLDVQGLLQAASTEDLSMAREALKLIHSRGRNYKKDLLIELEKDIEKHAPSLRQAKEQSVRNF